MSLAGSGFHWVGRIQTPIPVEYRPPPPPPRYFLYRKVPLDRVSVLCLKQGFFPSLCLNSVIPEDLLLLFSPSTTQLSLISCAIIETPETQTWVRSYCFEYGLVLNTIPRRARTSLPWEIGSNAQSHRRPYIGIMFSLSPIQHTRQHPQEHAPLSYSSARMHKRWKTPNTCLYIFGIYIISKTICEGMSVFKEAKQMGNDDCLTNHYWEGCMNTLDTG